MASLHRRNPHFPRDDSSAFCSIYAFHSKCCLSDYRPQASHFADNTTQQPSS